jgi:hypothetical protein
MSLRAFAIASLLGACGASRPALEAEATTVVVVPPAQASETASAGSLPGRVPQPPPAPDPFEYYVGAWEGLVNDTVQTELVVDANGRFLVRASATAWRPDCELSGRFRAAEETIWMDVERTTCSVLPQGTTLEREVLDKTDDQVTVRSPERDLTIRYSRRRP